MSIFKIDFARIISAAIIGFVIVVGASGVNAADRIEDLINAVIYSKTGEVKRLLNDGVDVNGKDNGIYHKTALMFVHDLEIAKLLLVKGADINFRDTAGRTPLIEIGHRPDFEVIKLLIERGADVNATDNYGETVLLGVAEYGDPETVELLLAKGAYINARDGDGETVLMRAVKTDDPEMINLLVARGVNINAIDSQSETALYKATKGGYDNIARILKAHGAK